MNRYRVGDIFQLKLFLPQQLLLVVYFGIYDAEFVENSVVRAAKINRESQDGCYVEDNKNKSESKHNYLIW